MNHEEMFLDKSTDIYAWITADVVNKIEEPALQSDFKG
jgi:hypothetical protein